MAGRANGWLAERSRQAGYRSLTELAADLDVSFTAVSRWSTGRVKPRFEYVQNLSALIHVPVSDIVAQLWQERPGEACGCGCGGFKRMPAGRNDKRILRLPVERTCPSCGAVELFDGAINRHSSGCNSCVQRAEKVERVVLTCPDCGTAWRKTPAQLLVDTRKGVSSADIDWEMMRGSRRCQRCALRAANESKRGARLVPYVTLTCPDCGAGREMRENTVRWFVEHGKAYAKADIDWESLTASVRCQKCARENRFKDLVRRNGRSRERAVAALRKRGLRPLTPEEQEAGRLKAQASIRGSKRPEHVRRAFAIAKLDPFSPTHGPFGYCELCGLITLGGTRWHQMCLTDWSRGPGRGQRGPGRLAFPESPAKSEMGGRSRQDPNRAYAAAVMRAQGDEWALIARTVRFKTADAARKSVQKFLDDLPSDTRGGRRLARVRGLLVGTDT